MIFIRLNGVDAETAIKAYHEKLEELQNNIKK